MGFKQVELTPLQTNNLSATLPGYHQEMAKIFQVSRTDTTASIKCVLPADASIIGFIVAGVASDAATTAVVTLGSTVAANEFSSADVKGGGTYVRPTNNGTNLVQLENTPLGLDRVIYAKYAETGTASTVGGPWKVVVTYAR